MQGGRGHTGKAVSVGKIRIMVRKNTRHFPNIRATFSKYKAKKVSCFLKTAKNICISKNILQLRWTKHGSYAKLRPKDRRRWRYGRFV